MIFQPQVILLVDRDLEHAPLIREGLDRDRIANAVHAVASGTEAWDYLLGKGPYADRVAYPLPCLVFLDPSIERGFELLAQIRAHPELRRLPVVALAHSNDPAQIDRVYALGANSYLVKPLDPFKLRELVKSINAYWVILVQKPTFY
jgi:CheY-like chemotaxis protein